MISCPLRSTAAVVSTAFTTYDRSGSLVLRSGVGTQMSMTSASPSDAGSVVGISIPVFTASATCSEGTSGM